jgi:integrase
MRRGETLGLTWRAVDLDCGRLSVEQQLLPTPGGATLGPPKSASRRTVALDPVTVEALREHCAVQVLERDPPVTRTRIANSHSLIRSAGPSIP